MNHKLVFIGGLQKSGTTLLFRCLRDHPRIGGFNNTGVPADEGQFLQSVYPTDQACGGAGHFGFEPSSYLNENSALVSPDTARQLFLEWAKYWDLEKPLLLEKSPPNLIRSRFLQALFPNSCFIIIMRHPIAVAYATQKWTKTPIHSLLEHWLTCHERFDADKEHLENLFVLKYEDFVAAPQLILQQIYAFLAIEPTPLTQQIHSEVNNKYLWIWRDIQSGKPTGSYTNCGYILARFEERVNRFGYSLEDLDLAEEFR